MWTRLRTRSAAAAKAVRKVIGTDDLALALALMLIARGLWLVWQPGAYLVPGLVILWIALPARVAFVVRPSQPPSKRHAGEQE